MVPRSLRHPTHRDANSRPWPRSDIGAIAITGRPSCSMRKVSTSCRGPIPTASRKRHGRVIWHLLVVFTGNTFNRNFSYFKRYYSQFQAPLSSFKANSHDVNGRIGGTSEVLATNPIFSMRFAFDPLNSLGLYSELSEFSMIFPSLISLDTAQNQP